LAQGADIVKPQSIVTPSNDGVQPSRKRVAWLDPVTSTG